MPNGLLTRLPAGTTFDSTRPMILPSLGASVAPAHRWAARTLPVAAGEQVTSWLDQYGGKAMTPNAVDTTPDSIPPLLRVDAGGEKYVHTQGKLTVTFTASTDLVTFSSAHGLVVNDQIQFSDVTTVVGVLAKTTYYVKTVPSSTTLTLSATLGGSTLDITTDGTGNWQHGLSLAAADLTAANHKTIGFLFRRPSGSGFIWSGSNAILTTSGATVNVTAGSGGALTPAVSIFTGWHIVFVRINGVSGQADFILDGVKSTAGGTVTAISKFNLNAEVSTAPASPTEYVEVMSWASVLSEADCALVRASLKATYSTLSGGIA